MNGDSRGRAYGGIGARASMPFSKLYDGVESELLNINGIYHKMTFAGNYYSAWSNTPSSVLPQPDRLNDDATQQSVRDMTPNQQTYVPVRGRQHAVQFAALRSTALCHSALVDMRVDTLDSIQVLQGETAQRWQTKRGYPGMEHTVDYVTLDLSASFFPAKDHDNFGHSVAFLEYDFTWAVGDNNGFTSSGWVDPFAFGTRYWNIGGYFIRPTAPTSRSPIAVSSPFTANWSARRSRTLQSEILRIVLDRLRSKGYQQPEQPVEPDADGHRPDLVDRLQLQRAAE